MSEPYYSTLRFLHPLGAFLGLGAAPLALRFPKGGRRHVLAGRCFVIGMTPGAFAGILLSVRHSPPVYGLLFLGLVTLCFVATGYLAHHIGRGSRGAYRWDRAVTVAGVLASIALIWKRPPRLHAEGADRGGCDLRRHWPGGGDGPCAVAGAGGPVPLAGRAPHEPARGVHGRVVVRLPPLHHRVAAGRKGAHPGGRRLRRHPVGAPAGSGQPSSRLPEAAGADTFVGPSRPDTERAYYSLEGTPMTPAARAASLTSLVSLACALVTAQRTVAQTPATLPSETPDTLRPSTGGFDYVRRDVMIPMRDGVKLHTVILVPKGANGRADPPHPHALRRRRAHRPRAELAPRRRSSTATTTPPR